MTSSTVSVYKFERIRRQLGLNQLVSLLNSWFAITSFHCFSHLIYNSTLLNINTYQHYLSTRLTMTIQYPSDLYRNTFHYLPPSSPGALPFRAPGACGRFPSAGAVPRPGGWRAAPLRSGESAAHQRGAGGAWEPWEPGRSQGPKGPGRNGTKWM